MMKMTMTSQSRPRPKRAIREVRELTERELGCAIGGYGTNGDIHVGTPP
jgi:hypothetical protein